MIGSREGLHKICDLHPDVNVTIGVVDDIVNDRGEVVPGLGDPGNRQFSTPLIGDADEEYLVHPSKRKKSDA